MTTQKRAVCYLRVSTKEQETLNQRRLLEEVANQRGWEIISIYEDDGISGDGKKSRKQFNKLLADATQGKFDVVMAWDVSRVSRNLSQLITFLNTMSDTNVSVYLHQQQVDTSVPAGRMLVEICGSMASFELALQKERIRAGLARRKSQGKKLGRPSVYHSGMNKAIKELRDAGMSIKKIAKTLEIGIGTVYRGLDEAYTN
jgi:DNA invertase Pin-like site-specific DNA recombinase|tara:strand:+ start:178 stop:780 length:603 start_codon:yes stop_codon:yes gene_type:complete